MKDLGVKLIQIMQFKILQPFYLLLLKVVLGLMNYGVGGSSFGNGEIKTLKLVDRYLKAVKNPVIFDVGANVGQYMNDINEYIATASTIYCFEPQLNAFKELLKNIPAKTPHVINPVNIGFGDTEGSFDIYSESEGKNDITHSCASLMPSNITNFLSQNTNKETIAIDTIDSFCNKDNIEHISFLKIDIEGYELQCLKGAKGMIKNGKIDIIQIEHNRCAIASRTFLRDYRDLFSKQYVICRPLSNNKGWYAIKDYDVYLENFTYINYVMIKKDIYTTYFI